MKKIGNYFFVFVSVLLFFSGVDFAHSLWINASDYSPDFYNKFGGSTKVYFGWGHHYPVDDFLNYEELQEFSLIYPDGTKEEIKPGNGGFLETQIRFKESGSYLVAAIKKPGYYTMFVEKGTVHHKIGPKTGLKGVILSLYYELYTKCLINVGDVQDNSFSKPVGHKLEIIPLKNPNTISGYNENYLPVKVLFKGRPARFCKIYATYAGFSTKDDFAYATSTNSEGIARIRILHWGPWLIKARKEIPAPDSLKDKCNTLTYTATLTFEIE